MLLRKNSLKIEKCHNLHIALKRSYNRLKFSLNLVIACDIFSENFKSL